MGGISDLAFDIILCNAIIKHYFEPPRSGINGTAKQ
jgi:hypothetical protein